MPMQSWSKWSGKENRLKLNVLKSFVSIPFFYFFFFIKNKIYIDNSKVEEKDERSFPQSTKLDQSKTKLFHCTRRSTDISMYNISQKPKSNSLKHYLPLSNYQLKAN